MQPRNQSVDLGRELVPLVADRAAGTTGAPGFVEHFQVGDEFEPVLARIVDEAGEIAEACLLQPVVHHIEGHALLADEQHGFAARRQFRQ